MLYVNRKDKERFWNSRNTASQCGPRVAVTATVHHHTKHYVRIVIDTHHWLLAHTGNVLFFFVLIH